MTIEREDIKDIVSAVAAAGIEDFSLEVGDLKVRLRRQATSPAAAGAMPVATPMAAAPSPRGGAQTAASATAVDPRLVAVTAPLVGTFYRSPSPGAPPFVEVGGVVEPDDTVCIVEVMKLMNAVRAGCRGRVAEICADNGALVEYGQALMRIDPAP